MSPDRDLMDRLVQVVSEMSEQGGEAERSRFYTGLIVLANSGSATPPPVGFVQVRFEGVGQLVRYFGLEPSVGDYVDVLMVYDQTPIILQNHTSGLTYPGWPFDTECATVDTTDPDADYATIAAAITAGGDNTILMSPETHVCQNQHLNAGENLRGMDLEASILQSTAHTVGLRGGDGCHIIDITIRNDYDVAGYQRALYIDSDVNDMELWRVRVISDNQTDDTYNLQIDDAVTSVKFWNCYLVGDALNNSYGLWIDNAAVTGPTIYIYGGYFEGATADIYVGDNATVYLDGPTLGNGAINIGTGATVQGWWYEVDGSLRCAGAVDIGSTVDSEKTGHIYQYLLHDIYPDNEEDIDAGFWTRYVNRAGLAAYVTHAREGAGIPTGLTGWQVLANVYVAQDGAFTGYLRDTFYYMYPSNVAPLRSFLADTSTQPITTLKWSYGRFLVTDGCDVGLRCDNYDSTRGYAVNERFYYYEIILVGLTPRTQIMYNHGYYVWNGAAWTGPTNTAGAAVTVHPAGEAITLGIYHNYGANTNTCAGYVIGEHGRISAYGSVVMFVGAGVTPFGARRSGAVVRNRGFWGSSFDWWHKTW